MSPPTAPPARDLGRCFRAAARSDHGDFTSGTLLADLTGDGALDLVWIGSTDHAEIHVWPGDREGRFRAGVTTPYDGGGLSLAVADYDHDGHLDVATPDYDKATITVWRGAGDGTLRRSTSASTYRKPFGLWTADLDADGWADLVVAHYFHVEVHRGGPGGAMRTTPWLRLVKDAGAPTRLLTPEDVVAADFTGDGRLDLVIPKGDVTSIELWAGRGRGQFRRVTDAPACFAPSHTLVGDVIEDGHLDLAVGCGRGQLELFAGDGAGGLSSRGAIGPTGVQAAAALADLDGDGHLDLIAPTAANEVAEWFTGGAASALAILAGDGAGGFDPRGAVPLAGFRHRVIGVVDVDGDGHLDVVHECFGQSPGGHVEVLFGSGCPKEPARRP